MCRHAKFLPTQPPLMFAPVEQRLAVLCKHGGTYFSEQILREVAQRSHGFSMTYVQEG